MLILDILDDTKDFFEPFMTFLNNLWNAIKGFFFGIAVAVILMIVLAIMNRN